jgi:hypothetical protein
MPIEKFDLAEVHSPKKSAEPGKNPVFNVLAEISPYDEKHECYITDSSWRKRIQRRRSLYPPLIGCPK